MQNSLTRKPIEIKIATVVAVAVLINEVSLTTLTVALQEMTGGTPDFFDNEFAIIDVATIADATLDWPGLITLLKSHGLHAVAVRNARDEDADLIRSLGLSIDVVSKVSKARSETSESNTPDNKTVKLPTVTAATAITEPVAVAAAATLPTMVIDTPIRAGQRIYARGCDLIITASVNNGAEVIADGSIHIYGALRGRALAGAVGNTSARIFAQVMAAELVSIAGIYRTFDNGFPPMEAHQAVQIKLKGDSIEVSSIKSAV